MTTPNYPIGLDLGATAVKGRSPHARLLMGSAVSASDGRTIWRGEATTADRPMPTLVRLPSGATYWCGGGAHNLGAPVDSIDIERLRGDEPTRALVYAALHRMAERMPDPAQPIRLMVGVPVELVTGEAKWDNAAAIKGWLTGVHTFIADGTPRTLTVGVTRIAPQISAAAMEFFFDDSGQLKLEHEAHWSRDVGLLSAGSSTAEVAAANGGSLVERLTAGRPLGAKAMFDLIDPSHSYTTHEMDERVRAGIITPNGEAERWADMLWGYAEYKWGAARQRFSRVVVCGGGVMLPAVREKFFKKLKTKMYIPADPVNAIADGLYRLAVREEAA